MRPTPFQAFVRIMMGCDKFCTYCIVPARPRPRAEPAARAHRRRGPAARRPGRQGDHAARPDGQQLQVPRAATAGRTRLSDLLARIHDIAGHRADQVRHQLPQRHDRRPARRPSATCPRSARYLHVPAQSGCDEVLKRMKRLYTVDYYDDMLARIRETVPGVAVSSDFIVGFCGETEESFEKTVRPGRARPGSRTASSSSTARGRGRRPTQLFADDVPEEVKKRRNNDLLAIQTAISLEDNRRLIGRDDEVLVEGPSRSTTRREGWDGLDQLTGRTACDRIVGLRGARAAGRADGAGSDRGRQRGDPVRSGGDDRSDRRLRREGRADGWPAPGAGELLDGLGRDR